LIQLKPIDMTFYKLLYKVIDLLEKEGKISYRALQREFEVDDETVDDIKQELVAVKQIARDIDGEMLELIPVEQPKTTQKKPEKSIPSKGDFAKTKDPIIIEPNASNGDKETITDGVEATTTSSSKKHILKWLGAALVLVGVLLPWVTTRTTGIGSGSANGLDMTQGALSIAAGLIGGIAGLVANKKPMSLKWLSLLILITGVLIIGFTLDVIFSASQNTQYFGSGTNRVSIRHNAEIGVFVTFFGGVLLFFGGLATLVKNRKTIKKE
jgi:hypothetical protein